MKQKIRRVDCKSNHFLPLKIELEDSFMPDRLLPWVQKKADAIMKKDSRLTCGGRVADFSYSRQSKVKGYGEKLSGPATLFINVNIGSGDYVSYTVTLSDDEQEEFLRLAGIA